jgi:hypothetical protein
MNGQIGVAPDRLPMGVDATGAERLGPGTALDMRAAQHVGIQDRTLRGEPVGYGAMRLAGPGACGPHLIRPKRAVLRSAVETGVNHIDTAYRRR